MTKNHITDANSCEHGSHPVGTTVKVTDLFKAFPVRRQDALKHSAKLLAKVKRSMKAYALTRPTVRFQLRVLKAKSDKSDFNYAPKTGANVEDATLKIIGRDCASQCEWTVMESDGFQMQAFLPKSSAIGAKISHEGIYLAVDSRPLSSVRGTMKKIVSVFKERLRKANPALASVKNPFLCMNIICPRDSYDPNIEPAKDDLLFENEDLLISIVDKLLKLFYPEAPKEFESSTSDQQHSEYIRAKQSFIPFEILEDRLNSDELSAPSSSPQKPQQLQRWRSTMYGIDEDHLDLLSENQPPLLEEEEEGRRAAAVSNPWTIAKMSSTIKSKGLGGNAQLLSPAKSQGDVTIASSSPIAVPALKKLPFAQPLTPKTLSQLNASQSSLEEGLKSNIQPYERLGLGHQYDKPMDEEVNLLRARQRFSEPSSDISGSSPFSPGCRQQLSLSPSGGNKPEDYLSPFGTPIDMIREAPAPRRTQRKQRAPKARPVEAEDLWFDQSMRSPPTEPSLRPRRKPARKLLPTFPRVGGLKGPPDMVLDAPGHLPGQLASENTTDIRNFFRRNKMQRQQSASLECFPASSFTPFDARPRVAVGKNLKSTVHRSLSPQELLPDITEQLRAFTEGTGGPPAKKLRSGPAHQRPHSAPQSELGDPKNEVGSERGLSITPGPSLRPRRHRITGTDALHRTRSSKLPLERMPNEYQVQGLALSISLPVSNIQSAMRKLDMLRSSLEWGYRAEDGLDAFALPVAQGKVREWAQAIDSILDTWYERKEAVDAVDHIEEGIRKVVQKRVEDGEMLIL